MPTNIKTLIVPSENLDYTTIDYRVALADSDDPIVNITEQAAKRVPNDVATLKPAKRSLWEIALWWLPLFIVLGAFLLRRVLLRRWMAGRRGSY